MATTLQFEVSANGHVFGSAKSDTIVIKAPAGTKARWVRQAQREGKKLSDWISDGIARADDELQRAVIAEREACAKVSDGD